MTHCSWHISAYSTHSMDMLCASKHLGHLINPLHLHTRMSLFMDQEPQESLYLAFCTCHAWWPWWQKLLETLCVYFFCVKDLVLPACVFLFCVLVYASRQISQHCCASNSTDLKIQSFCFAGVPVGTLWRWQEWWPTQVQRSYRMLAF